MAKQEISYALLLNDNVGLPNSKLTQIEAVIKITGEDDPLTLQKMRDVTDDVFKKQRTGLNNLVKTSEQQLADAPTNKQFKNRLDELHKLLGRRLKAIETELQKELTAYCKKDKELAAIYAKNKKLFYASTAWNSAKAFNASMKAFEEGTAGALVGGVNPATLAAMKTCYDLSRDLYSLAKEVKTYSTSEAKQRKIFKEALLKVTAIKPPNAIPKSLIDAVEAAVKPYPQKLMDIEMNAKAAAKKLDKLLKASPPLAKVDNLIVKANAMQGSRTIKAAISEISKTHTRVQSGKAFLKYTNSKLIEAKKREEDDQSWVGWAWEWANDLNGKYNDYDAVTGDPDTYIEQMDRLFTAYTTGQEELEKLASRM